MNGFYSYRFPKLVRILKRSLCDKLDENDKFTVKDYIETFLDFFSQNNAYSYFQGYTVKQDEMSLGIYLESFKSSIYIQRNISIEEADEEYEIHFELILDIPPSEKRSYKVFGVGRDHLGDFSNYNEGYFYFEDFHKKIISDDEVLNFLDLFPQSVRIETNANF